MMQINVETILIRSSFYTEKLQSGAKKQRLAIARAIIKDSPIVLLDEATASLDPENEYEIQLALNSLIQNKTVIMIAHRLNTVVHADQILVLDKGSIVERGTHSQLLQAEGLYNTLWNKQLQSVGWSVTGESSNNNETALTTCNADREVTQ